MVRRVPGRRQEWWRSVGVVKCWIVVLAAVKPGAWQEHGRGRGREPVLAGGRARVLRRPPVLPRRREEAAGTGPHRRRIGLRVEEGVPGLTSLVITDLHITSVAAAQLPVLEPGRAGEADQVGAVHAVVVNTALVVLAGRLLEPRQGEVLHLLVLVLLQIYTNLIHIWIFR